VACCWGGGRRKEGGWVGAATLRVKGS